MSGIIEVSSLSHSYGVTVAVDNISFSVEEGEIFSFLGPNGAGKSTVINILTTLLPLQKGSAAVAGIDVRTDPQNVREAIGIVFQDVTLDRDMTVAEILEFHGRLYAIPAGERKKRTEQLLDLVELSGKRNILTRHLSGGMKRRLEIARGLMTRPRVLFLDEPTIGLDPQTRMKMWDFIRDVNHAGTTIFLTTHYMDEADQLSSRISIIDHGRIIAQGRSGDLKNALGKDLIYFETSENTRAADILRLHPAVRNITPKRSGLLLTIGEDGTRTLPALMEQLIASGIGVEVVNLKKPTMDDVFVHYTGREIRDGGTKDIPVPAGPRGR